MRLSRRGLIGAGLSAGLVGCGRRPIPGRLVGQEGMALGHLVRGEVPAGAIEDGGAVDVLIAGAGVAGLSAALRLRGAAGRGMTGRIVELEGAPGGTAIAGGGEPGEGQQAGGFPWGAHYVTMPSPEARHMRRLLHRFGVITGWDAAGRPVYDPLSVCLAPQERLFVDGSWIDGLWPEPIASAQDRAERDRFVAECASLSGPGSDGRPRFAIPVAASSRDPDLLALRRISFSAWLDQRGYASEVVRWWLGYGCLDDYGTTLAETSAWAGLHYHCARRPVAAEVYETEVLTWPEGNGHLVKRLAAGCPFPIAAGVVLRASDRGVAGGGSPRDYAAEALILADGRLSRVRARRIILAAPTRAARRIAGLPVPAWAPDATPWTVAQLRVDDLPAAEGVPAAWDSVIHPHDGGHSLGYVASSHPSGRYGGPGWLTWYRPEAGDPAARRREISAWGWERAAAEALAELEIGHPDISARVQEIRVRFWGHGTARPTVEAGEVGGLSAAVGPIHFAHADLSGISLFEEASWHGIRAAEEVLAALGVREEGWR